jgi:hypothetical protein
MTTTDEESVNSFDAEDKDRRRRKEAYKLYKQYEKPTRENMCRILDYAKDTDVTRRDVDLLPWNRKETKVIKEVMQALKQKEKEEKQGKKKNHKNKADFSRQDVDILPWNPEETEVIKEAIKSPEKKEKEGKKDRNKKDKKERHGREDATFAKSRGGGKHSLHLKGQTSDSSMSLDIFRNSPSGSLDTSSSIWDPNHTQDYNVSAEQLQTSKVEEEHKRKREERRRKREETTKKSMPQMGVQGKCTTGDKEGNIKGAELDYRIESVHQWYTRMACPNRKEFKRRVADMESIDITPDDVDLLPWNLTGKVVNIAKVNAIIRASILKNKKH